MTLDRCPWFVAGPIIGMPMVGLRAALNKPFGALGGYIGLALLAVAAAVRNGDSWPSKCGARPASRRTP